MRELSDIIRRNGYTFKQLRRTPKKALYAQYYENVLIAYEVFKIRVRAMRKSSLLGTMLEPAEEFPGDEDFGKNAWTEFSYEDAVQKYNEL